jgi:hypothetical protein
VFGPKHFDTATSLSNLADLLDGQGDFTGATALRTRTGQPREDAGPRTSS